MLFGEVRCRSEAARRSVEVEWAASAKLYLVGVVVGVSKEGVWVFVDSKERR